MRPVGFTLPELVVTLLLVAVLAFMALPRLFTRDEYEARAFRDQLAAALRFAQKAAVAQRRTVCVSFASDQVTLTVDADRDSTTGADGCEAPQAGPTGAAPFTLPIPAGTTLSGAPPFPLTFAGDGRPSDAAVMTVAGGGGSWTVAVEEETGYVR